LTQTAVVGGDGGGGECAGAVPSVSVGWHEKENNIFTFSYQPSSASSITCWHGHGMQAATQKGGKGKLGRKAKEWLREIENENQMEKSSVKVRIRKRRIKYKPVIITQGMSDYALMYIFLKFYLIVKRQRKGLFLLESS